MLITYYDPVTFERKGTIARAISIIHNKRLYSVGSIQITLDKNTDPPPVDSLVLYKDVSGIVMEVDETKEWNMVLCYDMKGITKFRYIEQEIAYTAKTPEYIIKDMAQKMLLDGDRMISGLIINPDSGNGDKIDSYTVEIGNFGDFLDKFCAENRIGYNVIFNESNIVFDVIKERDNDNIIFSGSEGTLDGAEYVLSNYDMQNTVYYKDGETVSCTGSKKGILRREGMTDTRDSAEALLKEKQTSETLCGTAGGQLKYGIDYSVGDVVQIVQGNHVTQKVIAEVEQVWESGLMKETPVFGDEQKNPIKKLFRG